MRLPVHSWFRDKSPFLTVVLLCLFASPVTGEWTSFLVPDGLADSRVAAIEEDASGNLWFGTNEGVSRYDGTTWTTFNTADDLAGSRVFVILESSPGILWFGTNEGVTRYDGTTWTTFNTNDGLAANLVAAMEVDRSGAIWCGTTFGVSRYDGSTWTTFTTADGLADNWVIAIEEDQSGVLWFGTDRHGVTRFDGTTWTTFLPGETVGPIHEDAAGHLWLSVSRGVTRFDGATWTTFTIDDGLSDDEVIAIEKDSSGALWFGTREGGASRFDGTTWRTFTTTDGLGGNFVQAVKQDDDGNIWVGIDGGGVARYDGTTWTSFTIADGLVSNEVWALEKDRSGVLWIGTGGGVSRYDGTTWTNFSTADGLASDEILSIKEDSSGALWFGTLGLGVSRFDGMTWSTFTSSNGLSGDFVTAIEEDDSGVLWFGTSSGISSFDGTTWNSFSGLANNVVRSLKLDSSGALWIGTGSGVIRRDGQNFSDIIGLENVAVLSIEEDAPGGLWFGTDGGGVTHYDGETWTTLVSTDGLANNEVWGIEADASGALWFGTRSGVSQHRPDRVPPQTVVTLAPPPVSANPNPNLVFAAAYKETDGISHSVSLDSDPWSPWSATNSWTGQSLSDGIHTFDVRSRDRIGNVDPTPSNVQFEIDATPPSPTLASPAFGQAVSGSVNLVGTTSDPRFKEFLLESRARGETDWTFLSRSTSPIATSVLGVWNTETVADGIHEIKLSVSDSLGLTGIALVEVEVDNEFPFAEQTSPARITAASGGDVYTINREVHAYFPPGAFLNDAVVEITLSDSALVPPVLQSGSLRIVSGAEVSWGEAQLRKPVFLEISLTELGDLTSTDRLSIFASLDGETWSHLGGTVNEDGGVISTLVEAPGRYAVFTSPNALAAPLSAGALSLTPRVFSPTGGFANTQVAISFSLESPATTTVRIHSRSGRLVREVVSGRGFNAGTNVVQWDGRDTEGLVVNDGLYVVSVEALGETRVRTLAVVR